MRLLKCLICIAVVYLLSPLNGLTERDTLDGAAKLAIAAQSLAPEAGKALALAGSHMPGSGDGVDSGVLTNLISSILPASVAGLATGIASQFLPSTVTASAPQAPTKLPVAPTGKTNAAPRAGKLDPATAQSKIASPSPPPQPKPRPRDPAPQAVGDRPKPR